MQLGWLRAEKMTAKHYIGHHKTTQQDDDQRRYLERMMET